MADKLAGKTLGDFRLESLVGRGSVGKVYRATQVSLGRAVAVKVFEAGIFTLDDFKERFLREAQVVARLEHPHIIPVYSAGQLDNLYWFAMRLVEGRTLQEELAGRLPLNTGVRYLADIAGALAYAHDRGLVHRDVKPANILIADGAAFLTDFGLVRRLEGSSFTTTGTMLGTPLYFSPEQARIERATPLSDLFALGIILYEVATGRHPFSSAGSRELILRKISLAEAEPPLEAPPALARVIERSLRLKPEDRYPGGRELARDLLACLPLPEPAIERPSPTSAGPPARSSSVLIEPLPAMAATTISPAAGPQGRPFGRFRLFDLLGHGGMGVVYKAKQAELERWVAIKLLHTEDEADPESVARFLLEARAAARLEHPNNVPIYEVGEIEGKHYLTMDYVEGPPLRKLADERAIPPRRALEIVRDVARAIQYAHERGLVHRDLKPENILLDVSGRAVVTDFGLAKDLSRPRDGMTETGRILGTPAYMPPEQAGGRAGEVTVRGDIYSLGAVLYHLFAGRAPHSGESPLQVLASVTTADPEPPRRVNPDVPPDAETICLKAMDKDPERRYETAGAMADDLDRFLRGEPIAARPATITRRAWRKVRRRAMPLGLSLSLAALGLVLALFIGQQAWRGAEIRSVRAKAEEAYRAGRLSEALRLYARLSALDASDAQARERADECERLLRR